MKTQTLRAVTDVLEDEPKRRHLMPWDENS